METKICNALKNDGKRCIIMKNLECHFYQNKSIYLCKRHLRVLNNNNLKLYEEKANNKSITKKVEELKNNLQKLNINDDIYDNFCGKTNLDNIIKSLKIYKHILITGPSGIGKTLSVELIFNGKNYDIIYYKNEELLKFIENNNNKSIKNKNKVIIFDNLEELNIKEINQIFKINSLKNNIIIFICNNENINFKDLRIMKKYCYNVNFITPNTEDIFQYVKKLCFKNKININDNKIGELILSKQNDIRSITNDILFYKNYVEDINIYKKDIKLDIFKSFNEIKKKIKLRDKMEIFEQNDCLDLMLHENYCNIKLDINKMIKISGNLSFYDTLNCKEVYNTYEIIKYKTLIFSGSDIEYSKLKFSSYFINENKRKRKYEDIKENYYNYKKRYINTNLSLQDFINYKKIIEK